MLLQVPLGPETVSSHTECGLYRPSALEQRAVHGDECKCGALARGVAAPTTPRTGNYSGGLSMTSFFTTNLANDSNAMRTADLVSIRVIRGGKTYGTIAENSSQANL